MRSFFHSRFRVLYLFCLFVVFFLLFEGPAGAGTVLFLRDNALWMAESNGDNQKKLRTFTKEEIYTASLSPDGKKAVVAAKRDPLTGMAQLYRLRIADALLRSVSLGKVQAALCPSFSPDGKNIVLVGASDTRTSKEGWDATLATMSIVVASLDGRRQTVVASTPDALLDTGYIYAYPSFSPDGKLIAYQESGSDVSGGFVIVDLQGRVRFHYPYEEGDYLPFWKPQFLDQKRILCWSPDVFGTGADKIFIVNTHTGTRRFLAKGSHPALVDNGRALVYERWSQQENQEPSCDLWRLSLIKGARPRCVITNGRAPAGAAM